MIWVIRVFTDVVAIVAIRSFELFLSFFFRFPFIFWDSVLSSFRAFLVRE